ncbi:peptidase [Mycolicibacterium gadium]|uniref:Peptidase n=1 Tax=Mycolicibacterium gadium TaxID=1794 RepID=A0A7I7WWR2_MYCGU|nr:peptidase [Mycolicibacterium gadium]
MRALVLRLHFYAGLFVGPFLLIAAVSGALYAIAPSVEQFVYRDNLAAQSTGAARPVAEQIRSAQAVRPDLLVTAVRPAVESGQTTRVLFEDPTLGESERRAVFVDPVSARPQGDLVVYGNSGALPMRTWIDQLHRSLHLGDVGRAYSELAASWLWLIALAGVYLWVSRYRRMSDADSEDARLLTVARSASGRQRTLSWHGVVGLWIAAGLLFLSATGLTWSLYAGEKITELRAALSWTTPTVSTVLDGSNSGAHSEETAHGDHESASSRTRDAHSAIHVDQVDRVLQSARAAGVGGHVEVTIPDAPGTAYTVVQTRQPWVMSNNSVAVDGATGKVTDIMWFADWPLAAKLAAWGIQLHMGLLFGLLNQLALVLLAAALVSVIVRGYVMWWRRRPTRGRRFGGRPPKRGSIRGLPAAGAIAIGATALVIGWCIPLLGLSLLTFLLVDLVVSAAKRVSGQRAGSADERESRTTGDQRG